MGAQVHLTLPIPNFTCLHVMRKLLYCVVTSLILCSSLEDESSLLQRVPDKQAMKKPDDGKDWQEEDGQRKVKRAKRVKRVKKKSKAGNSGRCQMGKRRRSGR